MKKKAALWVGVLLASGLMTGTTANESYADGPIVVQMNAPNGGGDPFPIGWAAIHVPKGEVTVLAILPSNTVFPGSGENDPNAGKWEFEAWLADLAPPHRCPVTDPSEASTVAISNEEDAFRAADPNVADETSEVPICGSRLSSETKFRNFPGIPNLTFQKTYFPVSQGLLHKVGPDIAGWSLYTGRHKTNMGLRPFDVVGVTVEPPGTGARLRDYDPRPHPVVALIGRIPHRVDSVEDPGDEGGEETGNVKPTTNARRRAANSLSVR